LGYILFTHQVVAKLLSDVAFNLIRVTTIRSQDRHNRDHRSAFKPQERGESNLEAIP
jgi:hypothetical protein